MRIHGIQLRGLASLAGDHQLGLDPAYTVYSNPLPHVLILTAIVVGVATMALGLALVVRINETFGTVEEDEIVERDQAG